jgi:hypothetical protein
MSSINYYLQGFGFKNIAEYKASTFGFMLSAKTITWSSVIGVLSTFLQDFLGLPIMVFSAFVVLNLLEFRTGIKASKKKGELVESRKMGRMFLKVGTYLLIIWILHSFEKGLEFPSVFQFELDPFIVLYWSFLAGVIYQLFKSLLENLVALGFREAKGVLGFLIRKYNRYFEV